MKLVIPLLGYLSTTYAISVADFSNFANVSELRSALSTEGVTKQSDILKWVTRYEKYQRKTALQAGKDQRELARQARQNAKGPAAEAVKAAFDAKQAEKFAEAWAS